MSGCSSVGQHALQLSFPNDAFPAVTATPRQYCMFPLLPMNASGVTRCVHSDSDRISTQLNHRPSKR